uniref:Uncharacterized protein n=1 Tax=Arundo donax TaxID=35708 RepID=A0A0A9CBM3_ARUDO
MFDFFRFLLCTLKQTLIVLEAVS